MAEGRSLVFTFQPEGSVAPDLAQRVIDLVTQAGGRVCLVHLKLTAKEQLSRIANDDRAAFGKLRDPKLLKTLQSQFEACEQAMPTPDLVIDTAVTQPGKAAEQILEWIG